MYSQLGAGQQGTEANHAREEVLRLLLPLLGRREAASRSLAGLMSSRNDLTITAERELAQQSKAAFESGEIP